VNPKSSHRIPSFRHPKASGHGFVELDGRRIYLARFDRPESRPRHHQLIAERIANGRQRPIDPHEITVTELVARFWSHAKHHHRRSNGTPTSEVDNDRWALRPLKALYGGCKVDGIL